MSWLVVGKKYLKKDSSDIFEFVGMGSEHGTFKVLDLHGTATEHVFPHADLKLFRATDKAVPAKLALELATKLQMDVCDTWSLELEKAQVQAALLTNHSEMLVFLVARFSHGLFLFLSSKSLMHWSKIVSWMCPSCSSRTHTRYMLLERSRSMA